MRGTAVLVHGMWSSPADWRWVAERLRDNDVEVLAPDLPSHRTSFAGLTADAAEVRSMIARARPPVVAVGWSYGCDVIHEAAAGEPSVTHLVYIAGIPNPDPDLFPPRRTDPRRRKTRMSWCSMTADSSSITTGGSMKKLVRRCQATSWRIFASTHGDRRPRRPGQTQLPPQRGTPSPRPSSSDGLMTWSQATGWRGPRITSTSDSWIPTTSSSFVSRHLLRVL